MKQVDYRWHVAELMARNGMHNTTDLAPRLREYGIELSASQVYRLVTQTPDRLSLRSSARSAPSSPANWKTSSPSPTQRRKHAAQRANPSSI